MRRSASPRDHPDRDRGRQASGPQIAQTEPPRAREHHQQSGQQQGEVLQLKMWLVERSLIRWLFNNNRFVGFDLFGHHEALAD